MVSKVLRTGAAVAFLLTFAAITGGQHPAPAQPPARVEVKAAQPVAATTPSFRAKQVLGAKIVLAGNATAGTVDDIVFDGAGNLEYLIVAQDGKLTTVPWDAVKFDEKVQTATLTITPEVYKTIPTYTVTTYPDFWVPTYRTQLYKTYGLTPRELRRIERIAKP